MKRRAAIVCVCLYLAGAEGQRVQPPARPGAFKYWRAVEMTAKPQAHSPSACALLDADVFAHTEPTVADIRLFTSLTQQERPFAITLSRTLETADQATVLNLGLRGSRSLSFDLEMPPRPYSAVDLQMKGQNFVGTARVTGLRSAGDPQPTYLGVFTVFDLTAQHLGRSLSLLLAESTFPLLHVELEAVPSAGSSFLLAPAMLTGAVVPPSRVAQTLYTPVAETSVILERPGQTVVRFDVPARVPVERITFELAPQEQRNFSRTVTILARASTQQDQVAPEQLAGIISRVRLTESGEKVEEQSLSVPAILGANAQSPATVEVVIENEDDEPLKLLSARLEMRQRRICFSAPSANQPEHLQIFYGGGAEIAAPVYDFGRIFNPAIASREAALGPEHTNKSYHPLLRHRSFTEEYPELLWIALIGSLLTLGLVALRSARRI